MRSKAVLKLGLKLEQTDRQTDTRMPPKTIPTSLLTWRTGKIVQ